MIMIGRATRAGTLFGSIATSRAYPESLYHWR